MSEPGGNYQVKLPLAAPCAVCGEPRAVLPGGNCTVCGTPLPADAVAFARQALGRRRKAFKVRLNRLKQRMRQIISESNAFAARGVPRTDEAYRAEVALPALHELHTRNETVAKLLATGTWDPDEPDCIARFNELVGTLDDALTTISELRATLPPVAWRAVHRGLTRAAAEQVRGQVGMALTIIASDANEALRKQEDADHAFEASARHAQEVAAIMDAMQHEPGDGPFQADGSLDVAALAWWGGGRQSLFVANGAELVRRAFPDLPVAALPDEHAVLLLPLLASGVRVVDRELLKQRAQQLRAVLDRADLGAPGWIVDAELLVARVYRGLERLVVESERLGREWRYGLPRIHTLRTQTEAYRELVEGALRDFGAIFVIAARAGRGDPNGTYEGDAVDGVQAGEVVSELLRLGAPSANAVNMLFRNASAHADIRVADTGIVATERKTSDGRVATTTTNVLSDAEFSEELVALQEVLLAMQLAVLPWLWNHTAADVVAARATVLPAEQQRNHTLDLLAGMAGLQNLAVSVDGNRVTVTASRRDDNASPNQIAILSLVPAALGAVPNAGPVTLSVTGLRPVTFERAEFAPLQSDDLPHNLPFLGLATAKWLLESGVSWTERDAATYIDIPLTQFYFDCARFTQRQPHDTANIDQAVDSLRILRSRLDEVLPAACRSELTRRIVEQLDLLMDALIRLAESRRGWRTPVEGQVSARQVVDSFGEVLQLQEASIRLRDAGSPSVDF